MGDSCRYLTLLHFNMQTKRAHRYWHALFFKSSFKYTLSVGSRPLISISAMDISTLVFPDPAPASSKSGPSV